MGPGLSAYTADISGTEHRGPAMSVARQAGDMAFLVAPISLGTLAEFTSCDVALQTTAIGIAAANAAFLFRAQEVDPKHRIV